MQLPGQAQMFRLQFSILPVVNFFLLPELHLQFRQLPWYKLRAQNPEYSCYTSHSLNSRLVRCACAEPLE